MYGRKVIADIQLRKRALVIESNLNRLALRADWRNVCASMEWGDRFARFWHQTNPWLALLAPLAGVLTARTLDRRGGVIGQLLVLLKWISPLMTLWRSVMGLPSGESPSKPAES